LELIFKFREVEVHANPVQVVGLKTTLGYIRVQFVLQARPALQPR
jgi:hypothetical protein